MYLFHHDVDHDGTVWIENLIESQPTNRQERMDGWDRILNRILEIK
jgi:hypothetical protein